MEAISDENKILHTKTMWKKPIKKIKAGGVDANSMSDPYNTSKTAASNIIIPDSAQKINSTDPFIPVDFSPIQNNLEFSIVFKTSEGKPLPEKNYPSALQKYMNAQYRGKVFQIGKDGKAYFDRAASGEYSFPASRSLDEQAKSDKMRAGTDLERLLRNAYGKWHEPDSGHHPEATHRWDHYLVHFDVNGNLYSGKINIMHTDRGWRFHDITNIKKVAPHVYRSLALETMPIVEGDTQVSDGLYKSAYLESAPIPSKNLYTTIIPDSIKKINSKDPVKNEEARSMRRLPALVL